MVAAQRKGYFLAGVEPEVDCPAGTVRALAGAEFVVALTAYRNGLADHAHVMLPIGPFTETGGTFVNMEGRAQTFNAVVKPLGDSKPAWKVLRMLGDELGLDGFQVETIEQLRHAIAPDLAAWARTGLDNAISTEGAAGRSGSGTYERIAEVPLYASDAIVRRSAPLQKTADAAAAGKARMNPATFAALGLSDGQSVRLRQGGGEAVLPAAIDAAVPEGCVRVARGIRETVALGEGELTIEKVSVQRVA
jgi:NADH-quinone oxidoreductase subunit G